MAGYKKVPWTVFVVIFQIKSIVSNESVRSKDELAVVRL